MKRITTTMLALTALIFAKNALAQNLSVPEYFMFQSMLTDDGGNPVADGEIGALFKITDESGNVLYEERQELTSVAGEVSAIIGNGLTDAGAAAGPIPMDLIAPSGPRFLEVEMDGMNPVKMEIASVPYSIYSSSALGVADNSIRSSSIVDKSISFDDLSDELVSKLRDELTGGKGPGDIVYHGELSSLYRAPEAASSIGLKSGLVYSSATNLQDAISDLDQALRRREEKIGAEIDARKTAISSEATARSNQDSILSNNVSQEASARASQDNVLSSAISQESSARAAEDSLLAARITEEANLRQAGVNNSVTVIQEAENRIMNSSALPKAWGTVGINGSLTGGYNVASHLVTSMQYREVHFANPLPSSNYVVVMTNYCTNPGVYQKFPSYFVYTSVSNGGGACFGVTDFVVYSNDSLDQ